MTETPKQPKKRLRPIIKSIAFSEQEWERVERRLLLAGNRSFGEVAREALLDGQIIVRRESHFQTKELGSALNRIGNNINQVARNVNTADLTTLEEMRATRAMVSEIQQAVEKSIAMASRGE